MLMHGVYVTLLLLMLQDMIAMGLASHYMCDEAADSLVDMLVLCARATEPDRAMRLQVCNCCGTIHNCITPSVAEYCILVIEKYKLISNAVMHVVRLLAC
jgi:hypothetical protein